MATPLQERLSREQIEELREHITKSFVASPKSETRKEIDALCDMAIEYLRLTERSEDVKDTDA